MTEDTMRTYSIDQSSQQRLWIRNGAIGLLLVAGLIWLAQWWRYPPVVATDNLRYIQLLRTAISSERPDWVAKVKEAIDSRYDEGEMSDKERAHFDQIIRMAEAQEWKTAHKVCFQFEESQLSRRRSSAAPHVDSHDH
ncbi:hypothetical protein [Schlesneria sp. DSM 10557]|uniref:hypothetical protein n=2 Tax=unclassified Schlesneria TaxID=2762017 RepID=UPI00359FCCE8